MITVLSYNIRQWTRDTNPSKPTYWRKRAKEIRALIARENPDIILLQEATFPMVGKIIPDGYKKATGCSISHHIFMRAGFAEVEGHSWHIHYSEARIRTADARRFALVSVHSTWKESANKATCEAIYKISRNRQYALIAGGDWNNEPSVERAELFPLQVTDTAQTTFKNWKTGITANLDYLALSEWAKAEAKVVAKSSFGMSDHLPVILTI